jgi:TRAP-type C4-dicarboxylate transport system permease small subunit
MTGILQRAVAVFCAIGLWLAGLSLLIMILLVTADIIGRQFFSFSLLIADEYSGYLLIATTFMGGAFSLRSGSFTRMDVLYNRTKGVARRVLDLVLNLVGLVYLSVLNYWLWVFIGSSYRSGVTSISIAQTPLYVPRLFMGLGVTFLVIVALLELLLLFRPADAEKRQST